MITEIGSVPSPDGGMFLHLWMTTVEPAGERPHRRHAHPRFEISYVKEGSGIYRVGERKYPMEKGDVFVFSAGEQHCITYVGTEGLTLVNLQFEPRYLWGSTGDRLGDAHSGICFFHKESFENRIEKNIASPLSDQIKAIEDELAHSETEYALAVKSHLNLLLIRLIRDYDYACPDSAMKGSRLHTIKRVLTYIDGHFTEPVSLDELSRLAGLSPNYFCMLFRRVIGITLWDYISRKRIDLATSYIMKESGLSMMEIASRCGFNSSASFNKTFKKITGMTPCEYRIHGASLT